MPAFLYIEDHAASRQVMEMMLNSAMGYDDLTMFTDTVDIEEKLAATGKTFDIIFLDLNMKPLDGFEVCEILREHPDTRQATIVALTAHATPAEQTRLQEVGFDGAISKPIRYTTFPHYVERILNEEIVWEIE